MKKIIGIFLTLIFIITLYISSTIITEKIFLEEFNGISWAFGVLSMLLAMLFIIKYQLKYLIKKQKD